MIQSKLTSFNIICKVYLEGKTADFKRLHKTSLDIKNYDFKRERRSSWTTAVTSRLGAFCVRISPNCMKLHRE